MKTKFTLIFLLICFSVKAQKTTSDNKLVIIGQATLNAPADKLLFSVRINTVDSINTKEVFKKHQLAERKMVSLLQELDIPQQQINYTLFSLDHVHDYDEKDMVLPGFPSSKFYC